jgi:hypothetical protein
MMRVNTLGRGWEEYFSLKGIHNKPGWLPPNCKYALNKYLPPLNSAAYDVV